MKYLLIILMLSSPAMLASPAMAVEPSEMLDNPELEARARVISKGLRCLVCQNENIDDSNSGLAADLRILVRERLTEGDTNQGVVDYIVDRFGEYVLLKPTFSGTNMLLWASGPLLLILGGIGAVSFIRSRGKQRPETGLDEDETKKLASLLED
ncbi:MAG: cytochrome c-type biogenesis protein CcmH [Rhodobacteraceae bacterium]|nr:cytochrome c-type biogenesis protein CcmH [Paracoccaceae bacterium]